MKILSINGKDGMLSPDGVQQKKVEDIEPRDIETAAMAIMASEETNIDMLIDNDDDRIKNPAAKIIYDQLYSAFKELIQSKQHIINEIDGIFIDAENKYISKEIEN